MSARNWDGSGFPSEKFDAWLTREPPSAEEDDPFFGPADVDLEDREPEGEEEGEDE